MQGTQASETRQRQYCTENSDGTNIQEETLEGPGTENWNKEPGTRWQLCLKIKTTLEEFDRKAFGSEFMKRATRISSRLQKMRNWTLWRGWPPAK
jgi:hypothetical protein